MKSRLAICVVLVAHLWCVQVSVQAQEIIADTRADFSLAAQGTNGFQYGYYTADNVKGT